MSKSIIIAFLLVVICVNLSEGKLTEPPAEFNNEAAQVNDAHPDAPVEDRKRRSAEKPRLNTENRLPPGVNVMGTG